MTELSREALQLLDFLCAAKAGNCNVRGLKRAVDQSRLCALWDAKVVYHGTFEPAPWALAYILARHVYLRERASFWERLRHDQPVDLQTSAPLSGREPTEPPMPRAEAEGGDATARMDASPPVLLDRLLECFGDEFETLRVVAQRFGANMPQKIVRHARTLHERGLVEQSPPSNGQPFCLWRRAPCLAINGGPVTLADLPPAVVEQLSMPTRQRLEEHSNTKGTSGAHGGGRERAPEGGLANGPIPERKSRTPDTAASTTLAPRALLLEVNAFLKLHDMAPTRFGKLAVNDFSLVNRLRASGTITERTVEKVRAFIAGYQSHPSTVEPSLAVEPPEIAPRTAESVVAETNPPRPALGDASRVDIKVNIGPRENAPEQIKPRVHMVSEGVSDVVARARQVVRPEFFDTPTKPPCEMSPAKQEFERLPSAAKDRNRAVAIARLDAGETPEQQSNVSMKIAMRRVQRERDEKQRNADPVEQAKTTIRRVTRKAVFGAEVSLGPKFKGKFYVGRDIMTQAELMAYAKRLSA